jgi:hypothetical protein
VNSALSPTSSSLTSSVATVVLPILTETLLAGLSTYFFTLALAGDRAETEEEENG